MSVLPKDLAKRLKKQDRPTVVDVRSAYEFRSGHIPGALGVPFWSILLRRRLLPPDKQAELVLTCEHGPRAQLAAAQLGWLGYRRVTLLAGHMARWRRERLPLER